MFIEVHQAYDGTITSAYSYRYRISVFRNRFGNIVCDTFICTNEYPKAEAFYALWTKNMKEQPTLVKVLFHEHDTTDDPVLVMSCVRAEYVSKIT